MSPPRPVTLSVIMCNYNHARFIATAIEAVVSQSRRPDEFIIVDDASTDDSVAIISRYLPANPWIRFIQNEKNRGAAANIAYATGLTTGTHIYSGAADDFVLPGFFEKAMTLAGQFPDAGIIAGKWGHVDEWGHPNAPGIIEVSAWTEPGYISPERFLREYLMVAPWHHTTSLATIYNRKCLDEAGGFRLELGFYADTFALRAIALRHGCGYIPHDCACWRQLHTSVAHSSIRDPKTLLDVMARCVWLMRESDLKSRFTEAYITSWEKAYRAYVVDTTVPATLEKLRAFHVTVFSSLPHGSWFQRVRAWFVCRLSLMLSPLAAHILRRDILNYRGDVSCYTSPPA